jgi:tetratricopeptide (TPR) repeat protein
MPEMSRLRRARQCGDSLGLRRFLGALLSLAAFTLLGGVSRPTLAQTPTAEPSPVVTVSGTVRNAAGDPVADASVFLEEKATAAYVETKTKVDGTFSFLDLRPGTYTVRAEKGDMRVRGSASLLLSVGEKRQLDLVLENGSARPSKDANKPASAPTMEFDDKPSFTVAGVTDWTNVGGHGSDTKLRTSESLAKETAALKSSFPAETPATVSPSVADSHRLAGDRAERSGDPLAAEREYEEAVRLDPTEENYFVWGAELLLHRAVKPAAEVFTKGNTAHPKSARMLAALGAALYATGEYANASLRVCEASDLQPNDPTPYIFLGKMEKAAPDPLPCAREKLARFARAEPTNALANYYYAVSLWKGGRGSENSTNLELAETLLQKAITADPKLDAVYVQLGIIFAAQGNLPEAISAYKKAVEVNPQSAEPHYRLALAYKRTGEAQKSEQEMHLYKQTDKTDTATIEQQRREIRQFLIILKDQPQLATPSAQKKGVKNR